VLWQLDINERLQKTFVITNSSQYDIDFAWELKSDGRAVSIGPMSGRLEHGHSEQCQLTFTSQRPVILKQCHLILRVSYVLLAFLSSALLQTWKYCFCLRRRILILCQIQFVQIILQLISSGIDFFLPNWSFVTAKTDVDAEIGV